MEQVVISSSFFFYVVGGLVLAIACCFLLLWIGRKAQRAVRGLVATFLDWSDEEKFERHERGEN